MIVIGVVAAALIVLALATQLGVIAVERSYPATGQTVAVESGRIHFRDLGPRNGADLPIVMLHGASSNLGTMQRPLGEKLATQRRVVLIDRPGHGWSPRDRLADSTPAVQGRMIDEALGKLGIARAIVVAHSWAGALALSMALNHSARVAGLETSGTGEIAVDGAPLPACTVRAAARAGIGYVPEDRLREGLFLDRSIADNANASSLRALTTGLRLLSTRRMRSQADRWIHDLGVKAPSIDAPGLGVTTATPTSPKSGCGTPTTALSATPGMSLM